MVVFSPRFSRKSDKSIVKMSEQISNNNKFCDCSWNHHTCAKKHFEHRLLSIELANSDYSLHVLRKRNEESTKVQRVSCIILKRKKYQTKSVRRWMSKHLFAQIYLICCFYFFVLFAKFWYFNRRWKLKPYTNYLPRKHSFKNWRLSENILFFQNNRNDFAIFMFWTLGPKRTKSISLKVKRFQQIVFHKTSPFLAKNSPKQSESP